MDTSQNSTALSNSASADVSQDQRNGKIALICGIISLFVLGVILGPIAIIYGGKSTTTQGKVGRILGVIGLVLMVLGIALAIFNVLKD